MAETLKNESRDANPSFFLLHLGNVRQFADGR